MLNISKTVLVCQKFCQNVVFGYFHHLHFVKVLSLSSLISLALSFPPLKERNRWTRDWASCWSKWWGWWTNRRWGFDEEDDGQEIERKVRVLFLRKREWVKRQKEKRNRKKKERNIILMSSGNKKYYLLLALSYSV